MRVKNSLINSIGVVIVYIFKVMLTFIVKTLVIKQLGDAYNGLDGLFNSIISMLSITELGVGSAIAFKLYEPVKENWKSEIKSLMYFYKKCYIVIGFIVLVIGIILTPFIPSLIGPVSIQENVYIIYYGFLFDSVMSYFFTYKQVIFTAHQKNVVISIGNFVKVFLLQGLRIILLLTLHNYLMYVYIAIPINILVNIVLVIIANKQYPYLIEKDITPLSKEILKDTGKRIKGLVCHKIGGFIVLGTDNLLISKFCGVIVVGFYSNYILIVNTFQQLIGQMIDAIIPSLGNLLLDKDKVRNYEIYKVVRMVCNCIFGIISIVFCVQSTDFIELWIGKDKTLDFTVVYFISLNFYLYGMRKPLSIFEHAAGIFHENRFIPIFESMTNIIASVLLTLKFGVTGIIAGTTISSMWIFFYDFPKYVWKNIFDEKLILYYKGMASSILVWHISLGLTLMCKHGINIINVGSDLINWIIMSFILFIFISIIYVLQYLKSLEINYIKILIFKVIKGSKIHEKKSNVGFWHKT